VGSDGKVGSQMEGQHQQQKILIIDNDERVLRVLESFLSPAGFDTTTALSGHVALDLLRSQEYELVVVDDHLADLPIDGFLKEVKCSHSHPGVIVMESAPPRSWHAGACASFWASTTVNKWRPCEVLAAVREALSSGIR
jgi:DNA-binding response OmpR family regulator